MTDYKQHKIMVGLLIHVLISGELAPNAAESASAPEQLRKTSGAVSKCYGAVTKVLRSS